MILEKFDESLPVNEVDRFEAWRRCLFLRLLCKDARRHEDSAIKWTQSALEFSDLPGRDLVAISVEFALDSNSKRHH